MTRYDYDRKVLSDYAVKSMMENYTMSDVERQRLASDMADYMQNYGDAYDLVDNDMNDNDVKSECERIITNNTVDELKSTMQYFRTDMSELNAGYDAAKLRKDAFENKVQMDAEHSDAILQYDRAQSIMERLAMLNPGAMQSQIRYEDRVNQASNMTDGLSNIESSYGLEMN